MSTLLSICAATSAIMVKGHGWLEFGKGGRKKGGGRYQLSVGSQRWISHALPERNWRLVRKTDTSIQYSVDSKGWVYCCGRLDRGHLTQPGRGGKGENQEVGKVSWGGATQIES